MMIVQPEATFDSGQESLRGTIGEDPFREDPPPAYYQPGVPGTVGTPGISRGTPDDEQVITITSAPTESAPMPEPVPTPAPPAPTEFAPMPEPVPTPAPPARTPPPGMDMKTRRNVAVGLLGVLSYFFLTA